MGALYVNFVYRNQHNKTIMKQIITLALFIIMTLGVASAQEPFTVYCKLSGASYSQLDYGQETLRKNTLVDERGMPIYFNSPISAMNYMAVRGWRYVDSIVEHSQSLMEPHRHSVTQYLIFSKEVTSLDEVDDGITTRLTYGAEE